MHTAQKILMVRPAAFGFNPQTAASNAFQHQSQHNDLQREVLALFDQMVAQIRAKGIDVLPIADTLEPLKPDALFPNNWFATTLTGEICLYPMAAPNRRMEVRKEVINTIAHQLGYHALIDWSGRAGRGQFLEGTGSMVFDHFRGMVYAALSERTHLDLFLEVANALGYQPHWFRTADAKNLPIYHTNVLLSIGKEAAVVCDAVIPNAAARKLLLERLAAQPGRQIISITLEQMHQFCGNIIEVANAKGERFWLMSQTAFRAFTPKQIQALSQNSEILALDAGLIERVGGGGVRCMVAELF
jgi:hypothetical protein